eukprot:8195563-Alexandrium_andersonii.AAC.1
MPPNSIDGRVAQRRAQAKAEQEKHASKSGWLPPTRTSTAPSSGRTCGGCSRGWMRRGWRTSTLAAR